MVRRMGRPKRTELTKLDTTILEILKDESPLNKSKIHVRVNERLADVREDRVIQQNTVRNHLEKLEKLNRIKIEKKNNYYDVSLTDEGDLVLQFYKRMKKQWDEFLMENPSAGEIIMDDLMEFLVTSTKIEARSKEMEAITDQLIDRFSRRVTKKIQRAVRSNGVIWKLKCLFLTTQTQEGRDKIGEIVWEMTNKLLDFAKEFTEKKNLEKMEMIKTKKLIEEKKLKRKTGLSEP